MARTSKYIKDNVALSATKRWQAGLYLRISKEDGDKDDDNKYESDSIFNQRLVIEDYLVENPDIQIISEYADDGYTGTNFERPEFLRLIDDIRMGRINCVIVKDLSRFGRNYLEAGQYLDIFFPVMDIRFISVVDNIDSFLYPTSMNNISVSFKNVMNEEYCRDISNKIRSTFAAKRENGEYICGFALYGYVRDTAVKGQLVIDPDAADVVRQIFQWFAAGLSYRMITFKLNEMGIPNPAKYKSEKYSNYHRSNNSGLWSIQTVRKILTNRMYTGDLVQGKYEKVSHKVEKVRMLSEDKWVIIENHHEKIIDKSLFFAIQGIMNRDVRVSPKTQELSLFAGFLRCADCGKQLVKKNASRAKFREKYHYYTCKTYDNMTKAACSRHTVRSDLLEKTVLTVISKYIDAAVEIDRLIEKISQSPNKRSSASQLEKILVEKENEKSKTNRILLDLYPDYKNALISKTQYLMLKEKYETELKSIESVINKLNGLLAQEKNCIDESTELVKHFIKYRNIDRLTREILIALVDVIYVHENKGIEIIFKFQDTFKNALDYVNINRNLLDEFEQENLLQVTTNINQEVAL